MALQLKCEIRPLSSRWPDRSLMYPGNWLFTWVKPPGMPWLLVSIEPHSPSA